MANEPESAQAHWTTVWHGSDPAEKSWFEATPEFSMRLVKPHVSPGDHVVDIGAGASALGEHLARLGAEVTLVDVSQEALSLASDRLTAAGFTAECVVTDVLEWKPKRRYDLWHDRAVLHFLTEPSDIDAYVRLAAKTVRPGGTAVIIGFGPNGPEQCSGLDVVRRSADEISALFAASFYPVESEVDLHRTPSGSTQEFAAVVLKRRDT